MHGKKTSKTKVISNIKHETLEDKSVPTEMPSTSAPQLLLHLI